MGEEGSGIDLKILLSQGLLAASGFQGLPEAQNKGLQFGAPAFSISLLAGCIGFLENLTGNEMITKLSHYTTAFCQTMVIPLVAAEVCLKHGVQMELAAMNLAYPAIHYICRNLFENEDIIKDEFLDLSHTISLATLAYFSFLDSQEWGVLMTIAYALSSLGRNITDDAQANAVVMSLGNLIYASKIM